MLMFFVLLTLPAGTHLCPRRRLDIPSLPEDPQMLFPARFRCPDRRSPGHKHIHMVHKRIFSLFSLPFLVLFSVFCSFRTVTPIISDNFPDDNARSNGSARLNCYRMETQYAYSSCAFFPLPLSSC